MNMDILYLRKAKGSLMKKILFLLLSLNVFVLSTDTFDDFINQQIKIEGQLLDQNLSLEKQMDIKKSQKKQYKTFFILYTTGQEKYMQNTNPYRDSISKLKLRLNSNKHRGYTKAVMRDEVILRSYKIRSGIRTAFHHILQQTDSKSEDFFKDKIGETLVENFSKFIPMDTKKYTVSDQDKPTTVTKSLQSAVQEVKGLENITYTFAAEIVENSSTIYSTARFSKSKIYALMSTLDNSAFVQKSNTYLSPVHLDAAKIILLFIIIILILIVQSIIRFLINLFLKYYKFKEDDIGYISAHITKIFNYIPTLLIIHLILISYAGFSSSSINISKLFAIMYVLIVTLLFYRITNTVAYMKMESIRNNKLLKNEVVNLSIKVLNVLMVLIALIVILRILGVDLTAVLSGLGIAGAAVAFAAKDSIANIFASVSILLGDVFEQGEWIETKDVNGTVVEIGLRASTIRTFDNALISIPNSELASSGVKNWSRRSIGRRIKMNIGVTYQSSFDDIRQAITEIKEMLKEHNGIANERTAYENTYRQSKLVSTEDFKGVKRTTLVYMDEFSDSSINILVYCFSRTVDWATWLEVKEDVMYKIADIIEKNNLDFAYPTMTLHQVADQTDP